MTQYPYFWVSGKQGAVHRRLHREITTLGYTGGYSAVTDYLRSIRPELPRVFERRFETEPGEQAQADFAEFSVEFTDEPGITRKVSGCSRVCWATAVGSGGAFAPTRSWRRSCAVMWPPLPRAAGPQAKCCMTA